MNKRTIELCNCDLCFRERETSSVLSAGKFDICEQCASILLRFFVLEFDKVVDIGAITEYVDRRSYGNAFGTRTE